MDNYTKGKNVEQEETWETIPFNFESCPGVSRDSCTWMRVKAGSKMRNLIPTAEKSFKEHGIVLFSGSGPAATKAISIAEIIKRRRKGVHQYTKINFKRIEEHWDPKTEDLDALKVVREIPQMFILVSKDPLELRDVQEQKPLADFLDYASVKTRPPKKKGGRREANDLEMMNSKKVKNESNNWKQRRQNNDKRKDSKPKDNKPSSPEATPKSSEPNKDNAQSPQLPSPKSPEAMEVEK